MARRRPQAKPHRICRLCGRRFEWRRKWAGSWEQVRYCSAACRRRGLRTVDRRIERALLDLLVQRPAGKTICPGELVPLLEPNGERQRELLNSVRMAALRLHHAGRVDIMQNGHRVETGMVRGPIRLRLRQQRTSGNAAGHATATTVTDQTGAVGRGE